MPEVQTIDEGETRWKEAHARLQLRPAGYVVLMWVTGIAASVALCMAAIIAAASFPREALQPLYGAVCCGGLALVMREELKPEFSARRWRVAKSCERVIIVLALYGFIYMSSN